MDIMVVVDFCIDFAQGIRNTFNVVQIKYGLIDVGAFDLLVGFLVLGIIIAAFWKGVSH